jgi:hypothetical protein
MTNAKVGDVKTSTHVEIEVFPEPPSGTGGPVTVEFRMEPNAPKSAEVSFGDGNWVSFMIVDKAIAAFKDRFPVDLD